MSQGTRMLGDRYEVEATIGRGGMAEVFRGTDRVLGRTVAIKVLAEQFARDTTFVTRFRREAQSAAGLNHPNIVAVYDTGSHDRRHYIVMEYVEGRTVADILAAEGPMAPERVAEIGGTIAAALAAAHDRGMVHRDVKPANVMLTDAGQVKVMDFGIARIPTDDTLTQTGMVLGTAAYLSPEQAQGLPAEPASDVYSLGCVLYEMLAGQPPFTGDSPVALAYKHVREYPVPPSRRHGDIPQDLEAVVMRALAKEPGQRYADGRELQAALAATGKAAAATEPLGGRGGDTAVLAPAPEPAPPERRRRWIVPALLGAILVALLIVGLVALANQQEPARQERGGQGQGQEAPAEQGQEPPPQAPAPPDIAATDSVEDAIAQVENVLNQGIEAGTVTPAAADEIGARVQEAAQHYVNGEMEEALGKLGEAHGKVDEFRNKGEITSGEWAGAIHESLDVVASAMQANPIDPPEEEEGEGEEPGNSGRGNAEDRGQGQGEGKGKDKD